MMIAVASDHDAEQHVPADQRALGEVALVDGLPLLERGGHGQSWPRLFQRKNTRLRTRPPTHQAASTAAHLASSHEPGTSSAGRRRGGTRCASPG